MVLRVDFLQLLIKVDDFGNDCVFKMLALGNCLLFSQICVCLFLALCHSKAIQNLLKLGIHQYILTIKIEYLSKQKFFKHHQTFFIIFRAAKSDKKMGRAQSRGQSISFKHNSRYQSLNFTIKRLQMAIFSRNHRFAAQFLYLLEEVRHLSLLRMIALILLEQKQYQQMSEAKTAQKGGERNLNQFNKYLDNNLDVLHEKFTEYYGDPFPFQEVTSPDDLQFSIKYIYDVFNFGKYEANPALNKTLKTSLIVNIKAFVQKYSHQYPTFTPEVAVKLLKYCIENNEMFAVHYDKKKPPKKAEEEGENAQKIESASPVKNQQMQLIQSNQAQSPPKQENTQQIAKTTPVLQSKKQEEVKRSQQAVEKSTLSQMNIRNQFLGQTQVEKIQNSQLINKQLKGVFEFYCKQQQSISPHSTFDNINHKCQTMNLGKFMAFAIASNLLHNKEKSYSEGKLDKRTIVGAYKKIAGGQRQIGFTRFFNLMEELKKIDHDLYTKIGVGVQEPKGKNKLLEKLKYINLPFSTRDPEGRQILPYSNRTFVPKLTTHSGKNQVDLRDQMLSRKQRAKNQAFDMSRLSGGSKISPLQDETKFRLKLGSTNENIEGRDLNFLSRLIKQDENDELYLRDYQLPTAKMGNSGTLDKTVNKSIEQGRYNQSKAGMPFISKSGALTQRKTKQRDFILPSITKRGSQTQTVNQRHSIGMTKRFGDRSLLN